MLCAVSSASTSNTYDLNSIGSSCPLKIVPFSSMIPAFRRTASASISPEPHSPTGLSFPITEYLILRPSSHTLSTAPLAAGMPSSICAPSKAGPAAVAQHTYLSPIPSAISPFVPISRYSVSSLQFTVSIIPAVISPPTKPDTAGNIIMV